LKKQVNVQAGQNVQVNSKLEDLTGDLEILTMPQAQVEVDGKPSGVVDSSGHILI
jgi:hypothetical protein